VIGKIVVSQSSGVVDVGELVADIVGVVDGLIVGAVGIIVHQTPIKIRLQRKKNSVYPCSILSITVFENSRIFFIHKYSKNMYI
jgi:hypothetical protein